MNNWLHCTALHTCIYQWTNEQRTVQHLFWLYLFNKTATLCLNWNRHHHCSDELLSISYCFLFICCLFLCFSLDFLCFSFLLFNVLLCRENTNCLQTLEFFFCFCFTASKNSPSEMKIVSDGKIEYVQNQIARHEPKIQWTLNRNKYSPLNNVVLCVDYKQREEIH